MSAMGYISTAKGVIYKPKQVHEIVAIVVNKNVKRGKGPSKIPKASALERSQKVEKKIETRELTN